MLACIIWLKQQVQKIVQLLVVDSHNTHILPYTVFILLDERSISQRCTSNRIIKMSNSWIYKRFPFHQKAIKLSISNSINDSVFSMQIIKYQTKDILNRNTGTLIQKKEPDCTQWLLNGH